MGRAANTYEERKATKAVSVFSLFPFAI